MEAAATHETTLKSTAEDAAVQESERVTNKVVKKDPQKVEAGRKGAAVRNAKQKALLEQLQKAKEGFQPSHDHTATEAGVSAAAPESDCRVNRVDSVCTRRSCCSCWRRRFVVCTLCPATTGCQYEHENSIKQTA